MCVFIFLTPLLPLPINIYRGMTLVALIPLSRLTVGNCKAELNFILSPKYSDLFGAIYPIHQSTTTSRPDAPSSVLFTRALGHHTQSWHAHTASVHTENIANHSSNPSECWPCVNSTAYAAWELCEERKREREREQQHGWLMSNILWKHFFCFPLDLVYVAHACLVFLLLTLITGWQTPYSRSNCPQWQPALRPLLAGDLRASVRVLVLRSTNVILRACESRVILYFCPHSLAGSFCFAHFQLCRRVIFIFGACADAFSAVAAICSVQQRRTHSHINAITHKHTHTLHDHTTGFLTRLHTCFYVVPLHRSQQCWQIP